MEIQKKHIISSSLQLRIIEDLDARALFTLTEENRFYLRRWLPWLDSCTEEKDSLAFIKKCNQDLIQHLSLVFGMFHNETLIGIIGYNEINLQKKEGIIGYWLSKSQQNKGYATLACQYIVTLGFNILNLKKVFISCAESNVKSRNIPIKLGFQEKETTEELLHGIVTRHVLYCKERSAS